MGWHEITILQPLTVIATEMPTCKIDLVDPTVFLKKMPDDCCDASKWPADWNIQTREYNMYRGDQRYNCFPSEAYAATAFFERYYLGCEGGSLTAGFRCVPDTVELGVGYPMNRSFADTSWTNGT